MRPRTGPRLRSDEEYDQLYQCLHGKIARGDLPKALQKLVDRYPLKGDPNGSILYKNKIWPRHSEAERIVEGYRPQDMGIHVLYDEVNKDYCIPRKICTTVWQVGLTMYCIFACILNLIGHPFIHPSIHPSGQPTNQSTNQPTNQPTNHTAYIHTYIHTYIVQFRKTWIEQYLFPFLVQNGKPSYRLRLPLLLGYSFNSLKINIVGPTCEQGIELCSILF